MTLTRTTLRAVALGVIGILAAEGADSTTWRSQAAGEFVCFVYHRFGDDRYPSTNIGLNAFRGQLEFLRDEGFTVLTLSEAVARLQAGTLSGPTAVLTVDDGYDSFLTGAVPLLQEFGFAATLFVNSQSVGWRGMLDWDDLARLASAGMEIGNHTASHTPFLDLPADERLQRFREDVEQAQRAFQERLGEAPRVFSYPFGEADKGMRDAIARTGAYTCAVAQNSGIVSRYADRFALPRFPMGGPYATVEGFGRKAVMRALPVVASPCSAVATDARPELAIEVLGKEVRLSGAQCFVAGRPACSLRVSSVRGDTASVWMRAHEELSARRTLYTVTAPAVEGGDWHWFSHVWVRRVDPEPAAGDTIEGGDR